MRTRSRRVLAALAIFLGGYLVGRYFHTDNPTVWAGGMDPEEDKPHACPIVDLNNDHLIDVSDPIFMLTHLFRGGPPPVVCMEGQETVSTVIIVRHAERDTGIDSPLNEKGMARAERLAAVLADLEIDYLIASERLRTQQTLEPTAATREGLEIEQINAISDVVDRIKSFPQGTVTVVAHHSFTIHGILEGLELEDVREIPLGGKNHDNFLVTLLPAQGESQLLRLHYY